MSITTFVERIAGRQDSFVLFGDQVFDISDRVESPDYVELCGQREFLVPSMSFYDFELLDERTQASAIHDARVKYVKDTVDQELRTDSDVNREKRRVKALEFIMQEFFPHMLSRKYDSDEANDSFIFDQFFGDEDDQEGEELVEDVNSPLVRARIEIQNKLDSLYGVGGEVVKVDQGELMRQAAIRKAEGKLKRGSILSINYSLEDMGIDSVKPSVLGGITGNQPVYCHKGEVFRLFLSHDDETSPDKFAVRIKGRNYYVGGRIGSVKDFSNHLSERRRRIWNLAALKEDQDVFAGVNEKLKGSERAKSQFERLAKEKEFDIDGYGFILRNGTYLVYTTVPKFATQDSRDPEKFWPYDATRVAIKIGWKNGKPYSFDQALVVEKRSDHPIMYDRSNPFSDICILNRKPESYKNNLMDIVRKLSDAVIAVREPLTVEGINRHPGETYFGTTLNAILTQEPMSRKEAEKAGYLVVEVVRTEVGVDQK